MVREIGKRIASKSVEKGLKEESKERETKQWLNRLNKEKKNNQTFSVGKMF